jgi:hypothetical protein
VHLGVIDAEGADLGQGGALGGNRPGDGLHFESGSGAEGVDADCANGGGGVTLSRARGCWS